MIASVVSQSADPFLNLLPLSIQAPIATLLLFASSYAARFPPFSPDRSPNGCASGLALGAYSLREAVGPGCRRSFEASGRVDHVEPRYQVDAEPRSIA
jgi:hypothetical protein